MIHYLQIYKRVVTITSTMACTMRPVTVSLPKLFRLNIPFSRLALFKIVRMAGNADY